MLPLIGIDLEIKSLCKVNFSTSIVPVSISIFLYLLFYLCILIISVTYSYIYYSRSLYPKPFTTTAGVQTLIIFVFYYFYHQFYNSLSHVSMCWMGLFPCELQQASLLLFQRSPFLFQKLLSFRISDFTKIVES